MRLSLDQQNDFCDLYCDNKEMMIQAAHQVLRSNEMAEDAVQDSFVRMMGMVEHTREIPVSKQHFYCKVAARNNSLNMLKKQRKICYIDDQESLIEEVHPAAEDIYFQLDRWNILKSIV